MSYTDYVYVSKFLRNNLNFEDFKSLCIGMDYSPEYTDSCWQLFSRCPEKFISTHDLGKELYNFAIHAKNIKK